MNNTFFDLILKTGMAISACGTGRQEKENYATSLKSVAIKSELCFQETVEQYSIVEPLPKRLSNETILKDAAVNVQSRLLALGLAI